MNTEQKIHQLLAVNGAVLKRRKKHEVWQLPNGSTFVKASTPSDSRSARNSLRDLRKALGVNEAMSEIEDCVEQGSGPSKDPVPDAREVQQARVSTQEPASTERPAPVQAGFRVEHVLISPSEAKSFLELNSGNRPLSSRYVNQYAADMASGLWRDNGQPIIFSRENTLLDGQHRLAAVVQSNTSQRMLVIFDADPSIMDSIDIGKARTASDILRIGGVKYYGNAPGVARLIMAYDLQDFTFGKNPNTVALLSSPRVAGYVRDHSSELESACIHTQPLWPKLGSSTCVTASFVILSRIDKKRAGEFFSSLGSGASLSESSPIFRLRERLRDNKSRRAKLPVTDIVALIFKAWNLWVSGAQCQVLSFKVGDSFPIPKDPSAAKPARVKTGSCTNSAVCA